MGLFDLLSKDKRDERARSRNIQQAVNKYAQSADRMKALDALADDGSEEALYGLLKRFGMMYDKSIEDEQEKEWVFDTLVTKARSAIPPVKKYLFSAESISWPLRVLDKIALDVNEEIAILQEVLERHEPGYERDPTKKIQLLTHLAGLKHARVPALCAPYLTDMDEGVRYAGVEALLKQGDEAAARVPLLDLFVKEESLRLRLRIADGFAELGWPVADRRADVEKVLPDSFQIEARGADVRIKKKPGAKE